MPSVWLRRLRQEIFDEAPLLFVLDPGKQSRAELPDRSGIIEWHPIVDFAATEVTRHAFRLKDWFQLSVEVHARLRVGMSRSGRDCERRG